MSRFESWLAFAMAFAAMIGLWWTISTGQRDIYKELAAIQVSIAELRTELIRETSQNREGITKVNGRVDRLEALMPVATPK